MTILALVVVVALTPSVAAANHILTFFTPDNTGISISTAGEVNGLDHFIMQADLETLTLHAVFLDAAGNPSFARFSLPWAYGELINLQQVGQTVTVSWNIFGTTGGTNPSFFFLGVLTLVFQI